MIVSEEDFLEHYGKLGMKWGQRKANRALNKTSRAKDRQQHTKDVEKARKHFESGKARSDYKKAKAQYKTNKQTMGSREARKVLNKTKNKNIEMYNKSREYKNGKEAALGVLAVAGLVTLQAVASSRA